MECFLFTYVMVAVVSACSGASGSRPSIVGLPRGVIDAKMEFRDEDLLSGRDCYWLQRDSKISGIPNAKAEWARQSFRIWAVEPGDRARRQMMR